MFSGDQWKLDGPIYQNHPMINDVGMNDFRLEQALPLDRIQE